MKQYLSYGEKLEIAANWYREHEAPGGGWPMQLGETVSATKAPTVLSTAYILGLLRYAGVPLTEPVVQKGLRVVLARSVDTWKRTRYAVYSILALTEWPQFARTGRLDGLDVRPDEVRARIDEAIGWLESN